MYVIRMPAQRGKLLTRARVPKLDVVVVATRGQDAAIRGKGQAGDVFGVATQLGTPPINLIPVDLLPAPHAPREARMIGARTEQLRIGVANGSANRAVLRWVEYLGDQNHLHLEIGDRKLTTLADPHSQLVKFLPIVVFGVGLALSAFFRRSRLFFALLALTLAQSAFAWVMPHLSAGSATITANSIAILLPLNLLVLAFLRERGIISPATG